MTLTVTCLTAVCSIMTSDMDYDFFREVKWVHSMTETLLVDIEYLMYIEATLRHEYNKDLVLLLDENVYNVVKSTLICVKHAVDRKKEEGQDVSGCYMRTVELIEQEVRDKFEDGMDRCLKEFMSSANTFLQQPPELLKEFERLSLQIDRIIPLCRTIEEMSKCIKQKILELQYGKLQEASATLDALSEKIEGPYNQTLEEAYECTRKMRSSLDDINESALRQGLACTENPDYAKYTFSQNAFKYA